MNSKEIREISTEPNSYGNLGHGIQKTKLRLLQETAAQLAEHNEKMNILLNPPLAFTIDESDPVDLSKSILGIETHFIPMPIGIKAPRESATLRDQFAMAALQGMIANPSDILMNDVAIIAYQHADKMMESRK